MDQYDSDDENKPYVIRNCLHCLQDFTITKNPGTKKVSPKLRLCGNCKEPADFLCQSEVKCTKTALKCFKYFCEDHIKYHFINKAKEEGLQLCSRYSNKERCFDIVEYGPPKQCPKCALATRKSEERKKAKAIAARAVKAVIVTIPTTSVITSTSAVSSISSSSIEEQVLCERGHMKNRSSFITDKNKISNYCKECRAMRNAFSKTSKEKQKNNRLAPITSNTTSSVSRNLSVNITSSTITSTVSKNPSVNNTSSTTTSTVSKNPSVNITSSTITSTVSKNPSVASKPNLPLLSHVVSTSDNSIDSNLTVENHKITLGKHHIKSVDVPDTKIPLSKIKIKNIPNEVISNNNEIKTSNDDLAETSETSEDVEDNPDIINETALERRNRLRRMARKTIKKTLAQRYDLSAITNKQHTTSKMNIAKAKLLPIMNESHTLKELSVILGVEDYLVRQLLCSK
jgi:hypothetical protein